MPLNNVFSALVIQAPNAPVSMLSISLSRSGCANNRSSSRCVGGTLFVVSTFFEQISQFVFLNSCDAHRPLRGVGSRYKPLNSDTMFGGSVSDCMYSYLKCIARVIVWRAHRLFPMAFIVYTRPRFASLCFRPRPQCQRRTFFKLPELPFASDVPGKAQSYHEQRILPCVTRGSPCTQDETNPCFYPYRYTPEEMYSVVADVASYRHFIPYCENARVLRTLSEDSSKLVIDAELTVGFNLFTESYVSRVTCIPHESVQVSALSVFRILTNWLTNRQMHRRARLYSRRYPPSGVSNLLLYRLSRVLQSFLPLPRHQARKFRALQDVNPPESL